MNFPGTKKGQDPIRRRLIFISGSKFLQQGTRHAGIIIGAHNRWSVGEQMRRLLRMIATLSTEDMHNQLIFLSAWD